MKKKPKAVLDAETMERELSTLKQSRERIAYNVSKLEAQLARDRQGLAMIDGAIQQTEKLLGFAKAKIAKKEEPNG